MCQEEELAASCGRGLKPGDRFDHHHHDHDYHDQDRLKKRLSPQDYSGCREKSVMIGH